MESAYEKCEGGGKELSEIRLKISLIRKNPELGKSILKCNKLSGNKGEDKKITSPDDREVIVKAGFTGIS